MSNKCAFCSKTVASSHFALSCDNCGKWQHIKCGNTGVSRKEYKKIVEENRDIYFLCDPCKSLPNDHEAVDMSREEEVMDVQLSDTVGDRDQLNESIDVHDMPLEPETDPEPEVEPEPLNQSIEIDEPIQHTPEIIEVSMSEVPLSRSILDVQEVTYKILPKGSKRGTPLLVSTDGFSYTTLKQLKDGSKVWRCSMRNKRNPCQAKVTSMDDSQFRRHQTAHVHPPDPSLLYKKELIGKIKEEVSHHIFHSARDIVKTALQDRGQRPNLPKVETLKRTANRHREHKRPPNPQDLEFTINHDYVEAQDFIVGDLRVDSARHILLATPKQRDILRTTRRWFMDGTFKVVDAPFQGGQLMSIHGFVRSEGVIKQLPLMFIIMSRRRKADYVAVLHKVIAILGDVSVQGFVLDFEAGWHNRLNSDCGHQSLSFYRMVPALRKQALDVEIDIDELVDHGVGRQQRYRHCDKQIFELWDRYESKELSATKFLQNISRVYGPAEYVPK